jgi:hypothetical protein
MGYNQKIDPLTEEKFTPKRLNQKFASRENQIRFNNLKAIAKRRAKAPYEKAMDKNRAILMSLLGEESMVEYSEDYLLGAGFDFQVMTGKVGNNRQTWNCIFEFAIIKLENGKFRIKKYI